MAKREAITNPENTVFSIKRFMGRGYNEVNDEMKIMPFKVIQQGDHVGVLAQGKGKKSAEAYLGETVTDANEVALKIARMFDPLEIDDHFATLVNIT